MQRDTKSIFAPETASGTELMDWAAWVSNFAEVAEQLVCPQLPGSESAVICGVPCARG